MRDTLIRTISPLCFAATLLMAGWAQAQPDDSEGEKQPVTVDPDAAGDPAGPVDPATPADPADPYAGDPGQGDGAPAVPDPVVRPAGPRDVLDAAAADADEPIQMPLIFNAPTGHLLPAGIILTEAGVDTGGGISSDIRVGLGDVAEFGIGTNALINVRKGNGEPEAVEAYPTALFKMGIAEDLLFRHQPAISLGFRKSFEVEHDDRTTRIAQLYLVASKSLGPKFRIHGGAVLWDASVERSDGTEVLLHDDGVDKQLRAFGGIEIEPLDKSQILIELHWAPEFVLGDDTTPDEITLKPSLSWGVRYELVDWAMIESGVRVPDIEDVNLIDAQIFGQVRFVTRRFRKFLKGLN